MSMRVLGGIIAVLLLIAGLILFAVGSFVTGKLPDGELRLSSARIVSPTAAISLGAPSIDEALKPAGEDQGALEALATAGAGASVSVDVRVRSRTGKPVLVGIAPTRDFGQYLGNIPHDVVTGIRSTSPLEISVSRMVGTNPIGGVSNITLDPKASPQELQRQLARARGSAARVPLSAARPQPGRTAIWTRLTQGRDWQQLTWEVGPRVLTESLVVMNADGRPGIDVDAGIVVDVGFIERIFSRIRLAGMIALGVGALLVVLLLARRKSTISPATPGAPPSFGPPSP